ncbi:MAG: hypothetical protein A2149_03600 [Candidatus Schekmanbacteria bacterium RBG_16_38_11]|uniref:Methyltransferase domain-containing protein n=1 Tax=Candidatus Schekmanbacteria bacterium RBG_16_38_11 TaxID=1817880 RepID=A0A1F7RZG4_9BACT|nr:MAG: hypothetical protein A2149_03600 [Candidatus Schekmanbacteria bacterium RBG_16_38_11]
MKNFLGTVKIFRRVKFLLIFRIIEKVLQLINTKDKICMIPCGEGWFFRTFFKKNYKILGGDIDSERVKISYQRARSIWTNGCRPPIMQCNLKNLPFRDNSLNCLITVRTIGHFPPEFRLACLNEMKRVTKKWLLVQFASKNTVKYFFRRLRNSPKLDYKIKPRLLKDHTGRSESYYRQFKAPTGLKKVDKKELSEEVGKAGLRVVKIFPLFPLLSERWYVLLEKTE